MAVNDDLRDEAIRHAHALMRFRAGEVKRIVGMLNRDVFPELIAELNGRLARIDARGYDQGIESTRRLRDMIEALQTIVAEGSKMARKALTADMQQLAGVEARFQASAVERFVPAELDLSFRLPAAATLRSIVTSRPFAGELLSEHFDRLTAASQGRIRRALNVGLTAGETHEQITARIVGTRPLAYRDGALEADRRNVTALVRTATNHVSTSARRETYRANEGLVKGWQFVATLDTRTTPECQALDGTVYNVGEGPEPPRHHGCRSTTVPVLKSWQELGINAKDLSPGTRASMNGEVPADTTYGEWIRRQSAEVQDEALGPARAALLRDGASVEDFVDDQGRLLTLDEFSRIAT